MLATWRGDVSGARACEAPYVRKGGGAAKPLHFSKRILQERGQATNRLEEIFSALAPHVAPRPYGGGQVF